MAATPRSMPLDPSSMYGQGNVQSKPGMGNAGEFWSLNINWNDELVYSFNW